MMYYINALSEPAVALMITEEGWRAWVMYCPACCDGGTKQILGRIAMQWEVEMDVSGAP